MKRAAAPLPEFAKAFKSLLKWPMMKTKKVSSADNAGDENEEKSSATPVIIASSK
jgi:hypothetical protein